MGDLFDDLRGVVRVAKNLGPDAVVAAVGAMFIEDILKEQTADWTVDGVVQCVAQGLHIYPNVDEKDKEGWRASAAPYRKHAGKIDRNMLFKWFEAARPDLADAVMRRPGGWAWLVAEMGLIVSDILGTG